MKDEGKGSRPHPYVESEGGLSVGLGLPDGLIIFQVAHWWPKGRGWIERRGDRITLIKVRIPTDDADPDPNALVYNEDRSLCGFVPIGEGLRKAMDSRTKGYFFAESKGRALRLYGRAANQDW